MIDTNLAALLVARAATENGNNLIVIVTLILSALGPLLAGLAVYFSSRAVQNNESTEKTVKEIHVAVNSERSAMVATVEGLRDEILRISKDNVALLEKERARDVIEALKVAAPKPADG